MTKNGAIILSTTLKPICSSHAILQPVGNLLNFNIELNIIFDPISCRTQPMRRLECSWHSAASNAMLFVPVFLCHKCTGYVHYESMELKKLAFVPSFLVFHEYFASNLIFLNMHNHLKIEKSCHKKYSHEVQLKSMAYRCSLLL